MDFEKRIKDKGALIYGTTSCGEALLQMCMEKGVRVIGYCDDRDSKVGHTFKGIAITHMDPFLETYDGIPILIGIIAADVIVPKLKSKGVNADNIFLCDELLKDADYRSYTYSRGQAYGIMEVENAIRSHKAFSESGFFINNLDFVITEKCSLRCRECSNLMQYYRHPQNYDAETLLGNLRDFLVYVPALNEVRILGGEPFIHPQIDEIVQGAVAEQKIGKVSILSNATIFPSEKVWDALENDKVLLEFTDYGEKLSRNLTRILSEADKRRIQYTCVKAVGWQSCSRISDYRRDPDQLAEVFSNCCAKRLYTLLGENIYCCPFMAHADNLGAFKVEEDERFPIKKYKNDICAGQQEMRRALLERVFFRGCNYCLGRPFDGPMIPPAVQTKEILEVPVLNHV